MRPRKRKHCRYFFPFVVTSFLLLWTYCYVEVKPKGIYAGICTAKEPSVAGFYCERDQIGISLYKTRYAGFIGYGKGASGRWEFACGFYKRSLYF